MKLATILLSAGILSSASYAQTHEISLTDTAQLQKCRSGMEVLNSHSWGYADSTIERCTGVEWFYQIPRLYDWEFTPNMLQGEWIIYTDSTMDQRAYQLKQKKGKSILTKWFPNGKVYQEGYLETLWDKNIEIDFSNFHEDDSQKAGWEAGVVETYSGQPVAIGYWKHYRENGQLMSEGNYSGRVRVGVTTVMGLDGSDESYYAMPDYYDVLKEGEWKYYDADGKLVLTEKYEDGKLVDYECRE